MIGREIECVVKVVTYSLILIFKFRDKRVTSKKMQIFLSSCHFLRLVRQFIPKIAVEINGIPPELIRKLLKKQGLYINNLDIGNTVIFGSDFFAENVGQIKWLLIQTSTGTSRWVCSISLPIKKMGKICLCSYQLLYNLNSQSPSSSMSIQVFPETLQNNNITWASIARVSLLNSTSCSDTAVEKFKNFFSVPKYVQTGDLIELDQGMLFKVDSVDPIKGSKKNIGYLVENQKSSLFQLASVPSLTFPIEKKLKKNFENFDLAEFKEIQNCTIPSLPPALSQYCKLMQKIMIPFVSNSKNELASKKNISLTFPSFLLVGPSGSGKRLVVKCVADMLGLYYIEVTCLSLLGESSKASELRIRNVFQNARDVSPSILYLTDVEIVGKSREGNLPDYRILRFFVTELCQLEQDTSKTSPLFVIGSCQDANKCSSDIYGALLHKITINGFNDKERESTLEWLLEENALTVNSSLEILARRMHGFRFGDINAFMTVAARHSASNLDSSSSDTSVIPTASVDYAIDLVRQWQSRTMNAPTIPEVKWEDIGGLQQIIDELLDTIQLPLKFPELIQNGLKRSGILLYGPPGTGKTLLAKAVATECNLHFLSVKGPELLNMYVGQSEENVRNVFRVAREASPCLIFFDELDSLAPNRGRSGDSGGVMDRVVSQLLAELDGINKLAVVFVIGATNRPDLIDPALLRPGRFDKLLFLGINDSKEYQLSVLKAQARKFKLHPQVDLENFVQQLPTYLTGADLYSLCSNAMLKRVERNIKCLSEGHSISESDKMITIEDFQIAARQLVPSVSAKDLASYKELERKINQPSR